MAFAYAQLPIDFDENPKLVNLEVAELGTLACVVTYCARHLTDGFVPDRALRGFGRSGPRATVASLVEKQWLDRVDGGVLLLGYCDPERWNQPARIEVQAKREGARARKEAQRSRDARTPVTRDEHATSQEQVTRDGHVTSRARAIHSTSLHSTPQQDKERETIGADAPPGLLEVQQPTVKKAAKRQRQPLSFMHERWEPRPEELDRAKRLGIDGKLLAEDFRNYELGIGKPYADWAARFRQNIDRVARTPALLERFAAPPTPPPPKAPEPEPVYVPMPPEAKAALAALGNDDDFFAESTAPSTSMASRNVLASGQAGERPAARASVR